jgi:hypothetical protein
MAHTDDGVADLSRTHGFLWIFAAVKMSQRAASAPIWPHFRTARPSFAAG